MKRALDTLTRIPALAIPAALLLILIPTAFELFPELEGLNLFARVLTAVIWVAIALGLTVAAFRQGEQLDDLVGGARQQRADARYLAGERLLRLALVAPGGRSEHLVNYEFRLFLYDSDLGKLIPSYEPEPIGDIEASGWTVGCGATGQAWKMEEFVQVIGDAVSDGTYGLTPQQQAKYKHLQVVAAMPIRNARHKPIGILTASSTQDDGRLRTPEGYAAMIELAQVVARILIDVLRIRRD